MQKTGGQKKRATCSKTGFRLFAACPGKGGCRCRRRLSRSGRTRAGTQSRLLEKDCPCCPFLFFNSFFSDFFFYSFLFFFFLLAWRTTAATTASRRFCAQPCGGRAARPLRRCRTSPSSAAGTCRLDRWRLHAEAHTARRGRLSLAVGASMRPCGPLALVSRHRHTTCDLP